MSEDPQHTVEIVVAPTPYEWVVEVQDPERAYHVPLVGGSVVVGSSTAKDVDVVLEDRTVSRRHCVLRAEGGVVEVLDLGSRNGTWIGGARLREARVADGATVTCGHSTLLLRARRPGAPDGDDLDEADAPEGASPLPGVAGASRVMRRVAAQVRRLAKLRAAVLVTGETGSGKELVARALHAEGPRTSEPFVALNVAALPRELVESELFGHERGAFTGATTRRAGAFVEAAGGTLFLDEIGELPHEAQPKLLRALDGYDVRRVGASGVGKRVEARVVAATHVDLEARVASGAFRRDLFHRLEVFVVRVPPLRERRGDVPGIAAALLRALEPEVGPRTLGPGALARLVAHDWPGNVRELRNALYRAAEASRGPLIDAHGVERALRRAPAAPSLELTPGLAKAWLGRHQGNLSAAARAAGVPRTSFRKLVFAADDPRSSSG